jgi:hypothetical protein
MSLSPPTAKPKRIGNYKAGPEGPADNVSLGVQLLRDIRAAPKCGEPFGSNVLVDALRRMPDRPWNEYGKGARGLQQSRWRDC